MRVVDFTASLEGDDIADVKVKANEPIGKEPDRAPFRPVADRAAMRRRLLDAVLDGHAALVSGFAVISSSTTTQSIEQPPPSSVL